jgi:indolepyruvate ferredoxin oxidoreductase alpha subunit
MKHVGLNVASDAFMTYLYYGCKGGHIIVSADDPSCHSSQNEQDNRYLALFNNATVLEPTTSQEAKEMTRQGFEISEEVRIPILTGVTTMLNRARGPVTFNKLQKSNHKI